MGIQELYRGRQRSSEKGKERTRKYEEKRFQKRFELLCKFNDVIFSFFLRVLIKNFEYLDTGYQKEKFRSK